MINTTVCITLFLISLSTLSCVAAQCPGPAGYLGAYDAFSGEFVGAVSRIFPSHQGLGNAGALSQSIRTACEIIMIMIWLPRRFGPDGQRGKLLGRVSVIHRLDQ
ncbi:hypothetical protein C8R45DRAFT_198185 [Mycena sanguinolenta]|nr:hypothetical protein C8R45DRAFT_198185 [Mycena sanguinolenta]